MPIVSIDGWLRIINENAQFDGMEFVDNVEGGKLMSITCRMYCKDRARPTGSHRVHERVPARNRHLEAVAGADAAPQGHHSGRALRLRPVRNLRRRRSAAHGSCQGKDMGAAEVVNELPPYPADDFAKTSRRGLAIKQERVTAEQIICPSSSRYTLDNQIGGDPGA